MRFLIAAAGTGGHVFPGLAVGEALLDLGIPRDSITFVGGNRLEARVYPEEGFPFLEVELRGLQRSLSTKNLTLPAVVFKARARILEYIETTGIGSVLGMGGYVTIPAGWAAHKAGIPFCQAEQNAEAGLANRVSMRWASRSFVAFPQTGGMPGAEWVGNPVRPQFWEFDRHKSREGALGRYGLESDLPILGVFGGSLGAGVLNQAVVDLLAAWEGPPMQVVHLTGERNIDDLESLESKSARWIRVAFEDSMEIFYGACDLVLARAGGAVAELTATATPSILVPGVFGSSGHQGGNASFLEKAGAAVVVSEDRIGELGNLVKEILFSDRRLEEMSKASKEISRPRAAHQIASAMIEAAS